MFHTVSPQVYAGGVVRSAMTFWRYRTTRANIGNRWISRRINHHLADRPLEGNGTSFVQKLMIHSIVGGIVIGTVCGSLQGMDYALKRNILFAAPLSVVGGLAGGALGAAFGVAAPVVVPAYMFYRVLYGEKEG